MNNTNNGTVYAVMAVFALVILAGCYGLFEKISTLQNEVNNLSLKVDLLQSSSPIVSDRSPTPTSSPSNNREPEVPPATTTGAVIPTSIIFKTPSSPLLAPQTNITIAVDHLTKKDNGTIEIAIKAFTSEAQSYSALDATNLFALVLFESDNQPPKEVKGSLNSIPPQSSVTASLLFAGDPTKKTAIFQFGEGENAHFYEFNFTTLTYKETIIG